MLTLRRFRRPGAFAARIRAVLLLAGALVLVTTGPLHSEDEPRAEKQCQVCALAAMARVALPPSGTPILALGVVLKVAEAVTPMTAANPVTRRATARAPPTHR